MSASVRDYLKPDGVYIVSGIIDTRADDVRAAVSGDYDIIEENTLGGWYCFVLKAKQ